MAILFDILQKNELDKYPPLPNWVKERVRFLQKDPDSYDYYFFTYSIIFDEIEKKWTISVEN